MSERIQPPEPVLVPRTVETSSFSFLLRNRHQGVS